MDLGLAGTAALVTGASGGIGSDVARSVAFLCSQRAAGHVTGQIVTVAGGMEGRLLHRA